MTTMIAKGRWKAKKVLGGLETGAPASHQENRVTSWKRCILNWILELERTGWKRQVTGVNGNLNVDWSRNLLPGIPSQLTVECRLQHLPLLMKGSHFIHTCKYLRTSVLLHLLRDWCSTSQEIIMSSVIMPGSYQHQGAYIPTWFFSFP